MRYLTNIVDGDARSAINTLQLVMDSRTGNAHINLEDVKEMISNQAKIMCMRENDRFLSLI